MPVVLVAIGALGVAVLCLLVAYALTVLITPLIEGVLRQVPLIGGDLAGYARNGADWFAGQLISWVNASLGVAEHWFAGVAELWHDFVAAVDAYVLAVNQVVDHLVTAKVPELVRVGTAALRGEVAQLQQFVAALPGDIADVFTKPLSDFRGIEHGVEHKVDDALATIRNVDLPHVLADAEHAAKRLVDGVERDVVDLGDVVAGELGAVLDKLNAIPLRELLAMLAAFPALAALVQVIESEAGLDTAECRSKVKGICATDAAAWQALLDLAGVIALWEGIPWFVQVAQDFARELVPAVQEVVGGG